MPEPSISEDPPNLTEVKETISKLKGGKVVLAVNWQSCSISPNLSKGAVIPLRMGKGDRWN